MKKILVLITCLIFLGGCFNNETMKNTDTLTTVYPVEYVTNILYGKYSTVESIYPPGADTKNYKLTNKQKNKFSKFTTFIYCGINKETETAVDLLNKNSKIQLIDALKGMNVESSIEEMWLNPSNYLMLARNIKNGLEEYERNVYTKEKIEKAYEELKVKISEIDVDLTLIGKNAVNNNILVSNDLFNYLTKYKIKVISLDKKNENLDKSFGEAKKLIESKKIHYIYTIKGEVLSDKLVEFVANNNLEVVEIDTLSSLTEAQRNNSEDYMSVMKENIDSYKKELYTK
ncbi:MAG: metal ABC transporter substrate-binding protein [Bacilli bacterium]